MGTPLDPKRDHRISLEDAAALTAKQRDGGTHRIGDSGAFNSGPVIQLLTQPGCVGMRYYKGKNAAGEDCLVLVGVDEKGNDMVDGILLDTAFPCPPWCPDGDVLNK